MVLSKRMMKCPFRLEPLLFRFTDIRNEPLTFNRLHRGWLALFSQLHDNPSRVFMRRRPS
jgi:hypothetical protein